MENQVSFLVIDSHEFSREGKNTLEVKCFASEIVDLIVNKKIPFTPNVRHPSDGAVTQSIIASLESLGTGEEYEIESPIFLLAESCYITSPFKVAFITFGVMGGILDGGHRLLGLQKAKFRGIDLSKVLINFKILIGLSKAEIEKTAIALNTSRNPSAYSINNFQNKYDKIKDKLKGLKIYYHENDKEAPDDIFCGVNRAIALVLLLNKNYSLHSPLIERGKFKRHPTKVADSGFFKNPGLMESIYSSGMIEIMRTSIYLQSIVASQIDKMYHKKALPFVKLPKDVRQYTHLPTGEILSCKIPSKLYIYPIVSAFRAILDWSDDMYIWKVKDPLAFAAKHSSKLITKFASTLQQVRFQGRNASSIVVDEYLWELMYTMVEELYIAEK
jgi:hypothetical protein